MVNATDLSHYYSEDTPVEPEMDMAIAHTLGEVAPTGKNCFPYDDLDEISTIPFDAPYFCRRTPGKQEFAYRFKEYNEIDRERRYPSFTNRIITASSGPCYKYKKTAKNPYPGLYKDTAATLYSLANRVYNSILVH